MRLFRSLVLVACVVSVGATSACTVGTLVPGSAEPDPKALDRESSEDPPAPSGSASATPVPTSSGTVTPVANPSAKVELRVSGDCAPEFRDLIVATNTSSYDSIAVTNASAPTSGSFQVQMVSAKKKLELSTRERTNDRDVINVMAGGVTYTNSCNATASGCSYDEAEKNWRNDPIAGRVDVIAYEPRTGVLEVSLDGVVLQSTRGTGLCKLQGTVKTTRLGR
jgi:hypothetical protein